MSRARSTPLFGLEPPDAEVILFIWLGLAIAVTAALIYCRHRRYGLFDSSTSLHSSTAL